MSTKCCGTCIHWDITHKGDVMGKKPCKRLIKLKIDSPTKNKDDGHNCDIYSKKVHV